MKLVVFLYHKSFIIITIHLLGLFHFKIYYKLAIFSLKLFLKMLHRIENNVVQQLLQMHYRYSIS